MGLREELSERTKNEVLSLLREHRFCNVVRPPGFGKTYLMIDIATKDLFSEVVFVYPRTVISLDTQKKYAEKLKGKSVKFISYQNLHYLSKIGESLSTALNLTSEDVLFMFDESHFLGAYEWGKTYNQLTQDYSKGYFLGATATPSRTDGKDVTDHYFKGISPFTYTVDDAIADGIYPKPVYVLSPYDIEKEALDFYDDEEANGIYSSQTMKEKHLRILEHNIMSVVKGNSVEVLIRKYCAKRYEEDNYLKFAVFFSTYQKLYEGKDMVLSWFSSVYGADKVRSIILANDTIENRDMSRLDNLVNTGVGNVDLIFSIDKLSYGYHTDDLTGVMMIRYTDSDVVLGQQQGRAFNIAHPKQAVIFDLVGNLRRLKDRTHYEVERATPSGISRGPRKKKQYSLSPESVELHDTQEDYQNLILAMDSRRLHRKSGVYSALLKGIMPPEVACRELYISNPKSMVTLLKMDGVYDNFLEAIGNKFTGWEERVVV